MPDFATTHPHLSEFNAFLDELHRESDRGAVLISCSMIDELLTRSLRAYLIEAAATEDLLDGFNAPIGSFAARTKLSLALGLIDQGTATECDLLRKVRNEFAHKVACTFADQRVVAACRKLSHAVPGAEDARSMFMAVPLALACLVFKASRSTFSFAISRSVIRIVVRIVGLS